MYAIIATGGKQYTVKEGDEIVIEKLEVRQLHLTKFFSLAVRMPRLVTLL